MYSGVGRCSMAKMTRTQIHLAAEELKALDRESAATGASRSELIRRLVRERYLDGPPTGPWAHSIGRTSDAGFDASRDEEYLAAAFTHLRRDQDPVAPFDAAKDEEYLEAAFARLRRGEDPGG